MPRALSREVGTLPVWLWVAAGLGGFAIWRSRQGLASSAAAAAGPSADFTTPSPSGGGAHVIYLPSLAQLGSLDGHPTGTATGSPPDMATVAQMPDVGLQSAQGPALGPGPAGGGTPPGYGTSTPNNFAEQQAGLQEAALISLPGAYVLASTPAAN